MAERSKWIGSTADLLRAEADVNGGGVSRGSPAGQKMPEYRRYIHLNPFKPGGRVVGQASPLGIRHALTAGTT
jgi:hypothetical protein